MGKKKDAKKAARAAAEAAAAKDSATTHAAGFVVPDELRRVGETLIASANSPQGREIIASGLALAATAAAATAGRQRQQSRHAGEQAPVPPASPVPPVPPVPPQPGTQSIDPRAVADAIGDAAGALLTRLLAAKRT